ncbi:MAG: hypothetical protein K6G88_10510 [Lachnospiraceae bacterium]|nr:hypothetical protein [Lachnospiraceae bacterium]
MKIVDMRFDQSLIKRWIGKKFNKYKCDAFEFTNSVTQIVGLYIEDEVYTLTNIQEPVDYFGLNDEISVFKLIESENSHVKSAFKDTEMISTPINEEITSIKVVNELQKMTIDGTPEYEVWFTRAIIFEAGGREISFEKDIVPFSEEIIVRRGYNLIDRLATNESFVEDWDDKYSPEYSREIIKLG